jgi:hypothetical protein
MQVRQLLFLQDRWQEDLPAGLDSPETLVLVFADPQHRDHPALSELATAFPQSVLAGCSSSGEILGDRIYDGSLCGAVIRFEHSHLKAAQCTLQSPEESYLSGKTLAQQLLGPGLRSVLVFSDGLQVNGTQLVRGLSEGLPAEVTITGGLAGDGDRFQSTFVISPSGCASSMVCAVGLYGERLQVGCGSAGGWDVFGPERQVTRAQGSELFELDGRPALDVYRNYLGEQAAQLPASGLLFPLSVRHQAADEERFVRTILSIHEERRSLTFAGDIPEGSLAQLMHATKDHLIDGASSAAGQSAQRCQAPQLLISVSCVGRRLVMGQRTEEEIEASLEHFGPGCINVGFYSYGEIAPNVAGRCDLHNQTMTITAISEN